MLRSQIGDQAASPLNEHVLAEREQEVLVLRLNDPARLNPWSRAMQRQYFDHLKRAEQDPSVRAVVVTGAGRGFCSGADISELEAIAGSAPPDMEGARDRAFPLTVRLPLIAAINGPAAGLGLIEALYCDVRIASSAATFTTAFAQRGLIAEYGIGWLLPRIVGQGRALDLLLSGRLIDAGEALAIGLVERVVDPDDLVPRAVEYARTLAQYSSPRSMAAIKRQVHVEAAMSFGDAFRHAENLMLSGFEWPDLAEGARSYRERRLPHFDALPPSED